MEPKKILKSHNFLYGLDILLVHKGHTFIDEGLIYAPYIPMISEGEFQPIETIISRYASKIVDNNFYGIVNIANT
jgi:hypothetical protein